MKKAFTLIELLVVIAIIAILAAILFPVFAQAKNAAKKTVDLNNNKQIATSLYLYASDSDDTLCQTSWESTLTSQPFNPGGKYQIHWTYLISPYTKNYDMLLSPADPKPQTPKFPCPNGNSDIGKVNGSGQMYCDWMVQKYSYINNYNAMPAHDWTPVSLTVHPNPANLIMTTLRRDTTPNGTVMGKHKGLSGFNPAQPCAGWAQVDYTGLTGAPASGTWSYIYKNQAEAHLLADTTDKFDIIRVNWDALAGGGANYSYADGHAKFRKLDQTLNPTQYEYGDRFYPTFAPYAGVCN